MDRLKKLGAWLNQNGEAIYGTVPWTRAEGKTQDGTDVRFTRKGSKLYAILLAKPHEQHIQLLDVGAPAGSRIGLLGSKDALKWSARGKDLEIELPQTLPGSYAYVLEMGAGS